MSETNKKRSRDDESKSVITFDHDGIYIGNNLGKFTYKEWKTFFQLADAQQYIEYIKRPLPIFAFDKTNKSGKISKRYLVSSYGSVFNSITNKYRTTGYAGAIPCYYQIIDPKSPCNMFLDLEYNIEVNPEVNMIKRLELFITDLKEYMRKIKLETDTRPIGMFVLHSPDPSKVSFHIHFVNTDWLFENIYHCGAFVRNFVMWTMTKYGQNTASHPLFFKKREKSGSIVYRFFADIEVYTQSRPFRLAYCAKNWGFDNKMPMLKLSEWKKIGFDVNGLYTITPDLDTFLGSLPLYIKKDGKYSIVRMKEHDLSEPRSTNFTGFIKNGGNMAIHKRSKEINFDGDLADPVVAICKQIVQEHINNEYEVYPVSHSREEKLCTMGTYSTRCPLKEARGEGQFHTSNHVYFVVHYGSGHMNQRCKDGDCQGFITHQINDKWTIPLFQTLNPDDYAVNEDELVADCKRLATLVINSNK